MFTLLTHANSFNNYISRIWGKEKPLCLLFSTEENDYLYDTGTNNILRCEKFEFDLLRDLLALEPASAIKNFLSLHSAQDAKKTILAIEEIMKKENILKVTSIDRFGLSHDYEYVMDQIKNDLEMIQLELTENCNLRCGYCIYNKTYGEKRSHGRFNMTEQIARNSIDYLKKHSKNRDSVSVTFYGGEPLLNFKMLQKTLHYTKKILKDKELRFSITTNGTLINKEIAEFLHKENFGVL